MKLKFTMLAMMSAFLLSGLFAQESQTKTSSGGEYQAQPWLYSQKVKNDVEPASVNSAALAKQVEAVAYAISGYEAGATTDMLFAINLTNTDAEFGYLLEMTFPAGFTPNSVSNDPFMEGTTVAAEFNGVDGQLISWGSEEDSDFGGIVPGQLIIFSVNVTVDAGVSGPQDIDLFIAGDGFGANPGDFNSTITVQDEQSIAQIVAESDVHETLETAVIEAGLLQTLSEDGPFTVFAPTDDAFAALEASSPGIIDALLADPDGALANVLLYHVVAGEALSGSLTDGQMIMTLQPGGQSVEVTIDGGSVFINGAEVIIADIEASNGVVHVIDAVLVPEEDVTVWTVIRDSEDHTTAEAAIEAAGFEDFLNDLSAELTVFAPTDDAFDALEAAAPGTIAALLADPDGALANVLLYHIVEGVALSGDLSDGQTIVTLQPGGQSVTVTIDGGIVSINDAVVTIADIETSNGVVHVIDAVLVPEEDVTIWSIIANSEDHETLEAALGAAGFEDLLSDFDVELTVFAPTDAAFDALEAAVPGITAELLADPNGALANVLLYHVVGGTALSTDLMDGMEILTAQGETITVTIDGGVVSINDAEVIIADIEAVNGVVHVIDAVLVPDYCTVFSEGPFTNFNTAFGGAPVAAGGVCPVNTITGFQAWASEAYIINNFVAGTEYTFSLSGGASGAWDVTFVIQNATTGAVVAAGEGPSITWTSPDDGNYLVIIQESGTCGGQSENTAANNGFPSISCSGTVTVYDIIEASPDHNTLETALNAADLATTLEGDGPFTVFAPTDAAFTALGATLDALLADPEGLLTQALLYHVVGAQALSTNLSDGQMIETVQGEDVTIGIDDEGVVTVTSTTGVEAEVIVANLVGSNGVVHVIDAVLVPVSVNVSDLASVRSLDIYPNPANNQFTVDLNLIEANRVTMDLVNLIGQTVKSVDFGMRSEGLNREYIDINDLPQGFYLMNLTVGENQAATKVQIVR